MNNFIKAVFVALFVSVVCSCAVYRADLSQIRLGMTKAEAQAAIKSKPDNIVSARRIHETGEQLEIVQYTVSENYELQSYWLYFVNDRLDKWHRLRKDRVHTVVTPPAKVN